MDYLYDGTFDGLLTCIYSHYYDKKATGIYDERSYECTIFGDHKKIKTNEENFIKVHNAITNKISIQALTNVYHTYLSSDYNKDNYILKYLELGFKVGYKIDSYHTHKVVLPIHKLSLKVTKEMHLFLGILRFKEVGNGLYAEVEPDHNIIILLAEHFTDRLKNERFIIHDKRRNIAIIYNTKEWYLSDFKFAGDIPISEREKEFMKLWKGYFDHIGIESRKNLKLQRQFVPTRYRKNIVEFNKLDG